MLLFVLLAVFIAGLMIGRTPEYLGKNRRARNENDRAGDSGHADAGLAGFGAGDDDGCRTQRNAEPGPHGFSEVLYAVSFRRQQQR